MKIKNYMAILRNLRNILVANVSEQHNNKVVKAIQDETSIMYSKQLPIRFLSAYDAVSGKSDGLFESAEGNISRFKKAINDAIEISTKKNIPKIPGKTIIICDNSGSARGDLGGRSKLSKHSKRKMSDVGNLMGLMMWYACDDTIFGVFGDKLTTLHPDRTKGLLENFKQVNEAGEQVGPSTEEGVFLMIERMIKNKIFADRLIVCSDLQIGDGKGQEYGLRYGESRSDRTVPKLVDIYRKQVNPNLIYYSVCFNGHGTDVIDQKRILINGWSDSIFKFINTIEQSQVKYIEENFKYDVIPTKNPRQQVITEN